MPVSSASIDEAAEAREYEAFFAQQDPVHLTAVDWHSRSEAGLNQAEQAELAQWLAAHPQHASVFAQLGDATQALRAMPANPFSADARTDAVASTAPQAGIARSSASAKYKRRDWSLFGTPSRRNWLVACGVAGLAAGLGWHQWGRDQWFSEAYALGQGQPQTIELPDGSTLVLDAQTQAEVRLYSDRREVRLIEGQLMLSVAPNPVQPFDVLAGSTRVSVVGTRFSVRYRTTGIDADTVKVAVEEGHVRVSAANPAARSDANAVVNLTAGQALTVAANGQLGQTTRIAPGSVALWRKGLLRFENTPLQQVLQEFERYGPTGLVVRDPAVAAMPIGGSFQLAQPEEFARMLTQILPVKLVANGAGQREVVGLR